MTMNVLDVSNHQQGMKINGYDAYIFKATEGIDYTDKFCDGYVNQAKALGKPYGVYHFLDGTDVKQQAQYFFKETEGYLGEAIFILDYEAYGLVHNVGKVQEFCSEFTRLSGLNVVIYASESVINERSWNQYMTENHAFWVAKYSSNEPVLRDTTLTMIGWQYTGSPLDKSYFYITSDVWKKYAYTDKKKNSQTINTPSKKEIDDYWTTGSQFKAKVDLPVKDLTSFGISTGLIIQKGQTFDIKKLVNNKNLTTHAILRNDLGMVTLHKSYVDKVK